MSDREGFVECDGEIGLYCQWAGERVNIWVKLRLGVGKVSKLFSGPDKGLRGNAADCMGVCVLGKTSSLLFLHLLEEDAVFGADRDVLFASDVSRDLTRSVNQSQ